MDYYFITGSSRGIGRALVERALQEDDSYVYGFARSAGVTHSRYTHTEVDLSDVSSLGGGWDTFFPDLNDARRIVLINNAGTLGDIKYLGDIADESIIKLFNLNVTAPTLLMNGFIRRYRGVPANKLIVNVSSGAGKYPVDGWSGYCASKSVLDMISQTAALEQEIQPTGSFRIYALAPGVVDTPMQGQIRETSAGDFSKLQKFLNYHKERALDDPTVTAEKFFDLMDNPDQFAEVLQDVRAFPPLS